MGIIKSGCIFAVMSISTSAASQELTMDEARNLVAASPMLNVGYNYVERTSCTFDKDRKITGCCGKIPLGRHQLNMNTESLTRFLISFEKVGLVKMTPVDTRSGNVFQDLEAIAANPMAATVNVELATGIDPSEIRTMPEFDANNKVSSVQCFKFGKTEVLDVVRFDKIRGTGADGIGFDANLIQGVYTLEPSFYELRFEPSLQKQRKFQAVFKFDPFSKRWGLLVGQGVGVSQQFDASRFASKLAGGR
jgi:hypothetical protein